MNVESALDISNNTGGFKANVFAKRVQDNYKKLLLPSIKSINLTDNKNVNTNGLHDMMAN